MMTWKACGAIVAGMMVWGAGLGGLAHAADAVEGVAVRIGTFEREAVLVAFYKSANWHEHLEGLMRQRDEAKAKGDEAREKEIVAQGAKAQGIAHQQLAGKAPLDNIFEMLKAKLPEIAREAGVRLIVEQVNYMDSKVEKVDITARLIAHLSPPKPR